MTPKQRDVLITSNLWLVHQIASGIVSRGHESVERDDAFISNLEREVKSFLKELQDTINQLEKRYAFPE